MNAHFATKSTLDTWLKRFKDLILIGGCFATMWAYGVKIYQLPIIVEANAEDISSLKSESRSTEKRLTVIETKMDFLIDGIKKIDKKLGE